MSVQKKRRTRSSVKKRRSHLALKKKNLSKCPKCKKPALPHRACGFCGYYKGREAIKVKVKKGKGAAKKESASTKASAGKDKKKS